MHTFSSLNTIYKEKLKEKDFFRLQKLIEGEYGIKMPASKKDMLEARLRKRLKILELSDFTQYCNYLFSKAGMKDELINMLDMVTTNKTDFFRESDHFDFLVKSILPEMITGQGLGINKKLMIWSAGCSTGEEPYTLAMVLNEFRERFPGLSFQYMILATDLSSRVLENAKRAVYHENKIAPVPENIKKKYIMRSKDSSKKLVRIVPELRTLIKFRRLNFLDSNYGMREPIDIVFFRNVQIYFEKQTQYSILLKIYKSMRTGGYLFIGHSETINGFDIPFEQIKPTIYKKVI